MNVAENVSDNLTRDLRALADLVRAHDHVHPDRDQCGGVGGCLMLAAERDAKDALVPRLIDAVIRYGLVLTPSDTEDAK